MIEAGQRSREPVFPEQPGVVDPETMRGFLQPHFDGVELRRIRVHHFAWKPERGAWVAYELELEDAQGGMHRHFMAGCTRRHEAPRVRTGCEPRWGPTVLDVEALDLRLWGFPNDPGLRGIETASDPERLTAALAPWPQLQERVRGLRSTEVVKYVPRKRLVLRHTTDDEVLYTKTFAGKRGATVFALLQHLWERWHDDDDAYRLPRPLAYLQDERTIVQEALVGFENVDRLPADWEPFLTQVGRGLARVHTSGLRDLEPWSEKEERRHFEKVSARIAEFAPHLRDRIDELGRLVRARSAGGLDPVPIHTAFRLGQLLVRGDRIAMLDLDGFRLGDPLYDLATFIAHLHTLESRGELGPGVAELAGAALTRAYARDVPWPVDVGDLAWRTGALLVSKHAQRQVKKRTADAPFRIGALLERARALLSSGRA